MSGVIERRLAESGIEGATIKRRVKSIYGIYRKTIMQNKSFDEIYDIYAVRVILDTLAECYSTLGLIHDMYHPLPNRFKGLYLHSQAQWLPEPAPHRHRPRGHPL